MNWLAHTWTAVWPNLAANVLWVPLVALHHILMRRHVDRRQAETHARLDAQDEALNIAPGDSH